MVEIEAWTLLMVKRWQVLYNVNAVLDFHLNGWLIEPRFESGRLTSAELISALRRHLTEPKLWYSI